MDTDPSSSPLASRLGRVLLPSSVQGLCVSLAPHSSSIRWAADKLWEHCSSLRITEADCIAKEVML